MKEALEAWSQAATERLLRGEAPKSSTQTADEEHRKSTPAMSLVEGPLSLALLFGGLGHLKPELRTVAHGHLADATKARRPPAEGLYGGLPSLAFTARALARNSGDYATLLRRVDPQVAALAGKLVDREEARMVAGQPAAITRFYDVISGIAGLGRYLLACGDEQLPVLERILRCLVRLTEPVVVDGYRVPGWWTSEELTTDERRRSRGHFNVGMAHGIPGPLALLSLAFLRGVRVDGHEEAIGRIARWLLVRRAEDNHGLYWPGYVPLEDEMADSVSQLSPSRLAWCYGAPGIARAVQLAAMAVGEPNWAWEACRTLKAALLRPYAEMRLEDATLCHGSAGVLCAASLVARDARDNELSLALRTFTRHMMPPHGDPVLRSALTTIPGDQSGFLTGESGAILAVSETLSPLSTVSNPSLPWSAALLLA